MVVTVQGLLLVREFTVTHLLPYLLIIPMCGQWRVQWSEPEYWLCCSVGYYSTWLWIRICILSCGQVTYILPSSRWGVYVAIVFWTAQQSLLTDGTENVGHPACLLKNILIDSNLPVTGWHPWSFIVVLTAPKTSNIDLVWFERVLLGTGYSSCRPEMFC